MDPQPPLPDADRAHRPVARRARRRVIAASALAFLVLAIATMVAFTSDRGDQKSNEVAVLDNNAPPPTLAAGDGTSHVGDSVASTDPFSDFDGAAHELAEYEGKPLVINFWSSTCPPCVTEMPDLETAHQLVGDQVSFIGFDVLEQQSDGQAMANRTGVTYQLARDPSGEILRSLGGIVLPTTVFVDASGTIVAVHSGQISADELGRTIREDLST